jgi:ATP/ADP translocase
MMDSFDMVLYGFMFFMFLFGVVMWVYAQKVANYINKKGIA